MEKKINKTKDKTKEKTKYDKWVTDFTQSVNDLEVLLVVDFSNISKLLGTVTESKSEFKLSKKLEETNVTELKNYMEIAFQVLFKKLNGTNDSLIKFIESDLNFGLFDLGHKATIEFHKDLIEFHKDLKGAASFLKRKTIKGKDGIHLGLKKIYASVPTQSINKKSNVCKQFTKLCELCCKLEDHVSLWFSAVNELKTVNKSKFKELEKKINKLESEKDQKKKKQQKLQEQIEEEQKKLQKQIKDQVPPGFSTNKTENRMSSTVDQMLKSRIKPEKKSKFAQQRTEKLGAEQLSELKLQIKNKQKNIKDIMKEIENGKKQKAEDEKKIHELASCESMWEYNWALLKTIKDNDVWRLYVKFELDKNVKAFLNLLLNYNNNNKLIKKEKLKKFISNECINIWKNTNQYDDKTKYDIIRRVKNSVLNVIPGNANVRLTDVKKLLNLHFKKIDLIFAINEKRETFFDGESSEQLNKEYSNLTSDIETAEKELVKKPPWIVNNNTLEKIKNLLNLPINLSKSVIPKKEVTVDKLSEKYYETFEYIEKKYVESQEKLQFKDGFRDDDYWIEQLNHLRDRLEILNNELARLKQLLHLKIYEVDAKPLDIEKSVKYNLEPKRFKRGKKTLENLKINLSKLENKIKKYSKEKDVCEENIKNIKNIKRLFVWP